MAPPRTHPLARAKIVDRLDRWIGDAWDKGWMDTVPIDPHALIARASKGYSVGDEAGGRTKADIDDFHERLEKLCAAVQAEAQLNSIGRAFAFGLLSRAIQQRFALGSLWRRNPEVLETKLAPPIIVVGQMRSGTTRIHRLLAADPAHSATRFCDSWHPVPGTPDIRPMKGALMLFMARMLDPWIDSIHPLGASRADEELGWLASALDHSAFEAQWHIPSYVQFSEERDAAPVYREFGRILRTDAAHHGNGSQPRVLKTPQFAEDLNTLLAEFPDARVIVARRTDDETLKSSVSLVANQMTIQSDTVDLSGIESEWKRKLALRQSRMDAALAAFDGCVAEVQFDALGEDWEGEITRIYDALQLDFTNQSREAMRREMRRNAASPHLSHQHDLDRFQTGQD